jgi:hypothetical protein
MTDRRPDPALVLAARALAVVLDLEVGEVRADSPLADLGADPVALVLWADVAEELAAVAGSPVAIEDSTLRAAVTLGDLADALRLPAGAA